MHSHSSLLRVTILVFSSGFTGLDGDRDICCPGELLFCGLDFLGPLLFDLAVGEDHQLIALVSNAGLPHIDPGDRAGDRWGIELVTDGEVRFAMEIDPGHGIGDHPLEHKGETQANESGCRSEASGNVSHSNDLEEGQYHPELEEKGDNEDG